MKVGDELKVKLIRVNNEGKGVFLTEDEKLILIDDVSEDDSLIKIEITHIFEESMFAKKIGVIYNKKKEEEESEKEEKDKSNGPYEIDDEEDKGYSDDDDDYEEE